MGALPVIKEKKNIPFKIIDGKQAGKKYNMDGSIKRTHSNKECGKSSEVFAFRTENEIKAMIDAFDRHIAEAADASKKQIACRNKMMFLIGINLGIRASDLRVLKWSFFYDENMEIIEGKRQIKPKKTRKTNKFVPIFINRPIKRAIEDYTEKYPVEDIDAYIFASQKNTGRKRNNDSDIKDGKGNYPIAESSIWRILNAVAREAGIKQNIGSHSLRKTFGYWVWHNAVNKEDALVKLQIIFNHSSVLTTAKYIGIEDNEISDMYNSINLGFAFI